MHTLAFHRRDQESFAQPMSKRENQCEHVTARFQIKKVDKKNSQDHQLHDNDPSCSAPTSHQSTASRACQQQDYSTTSQTWCQ